MIPSRFMSRDPSRPRVILMADDDDDDHLLAREAVSEIGAPWDIRFVPDGGDLLAYLYREGKYADAAAAPWPGLVLLDLNMPRVDGREALRRIRASSAFRTLPVVLMTTSRAPADVAQGYELGANTVVAKPTSFADMVDVMHALGRYWLEIAEPSPAPENR